LAVLAAGAQAARFALGSCRSISFNAKLALQIAAVDGAVGSIELFAFKVATSRLFRAKRT
jgi:hypothetical protein